MCHLQLCPDFTFGHGLGIPGWWQMERNNSQASQQGIWTTIPQPVIIQNGIPRTNNSKPNLSQWWLRVLHFSHVSLEIKTGLNWHNYITSYRHGFSFVDCRHVLYPHGTNIIERHRTRLHISLSPGIHCHSLQEAKSKKQDGHLCGSFQNSCKT